MLWPCCALKLLHDMRSSSNAASCSASPSACRLMCQTLRALLGQQPLQTARTRACRCSAPPQPLWRGDTRSLQRGPGTPALPGAPLPRACQMACSRLHLAAPGSLCPPLRRQPAGRATPSQGQQQQQDLRSSPLLPHLMAVQQCRVCPSLGSQVRPPASARLAELPSHRCFYWKLPRSAPRHQGVAQSPRG